MKRECNPARSLLLEADNRPVEMDHWDENYLSSSHGFLPRVVPISALPESHRELDDIASELPFLIAKGRLRQAIDKLPEFSLGSDYLERCYLMRAATIIGLMTHGYVTEDLRLQSPLTSNNSIFRIDPEEETIKRLPRWLWMAWVEVCQRLNRKEVSLSFTDLVINNWTFRNPQLEDPFVSENLEMLIPYTGVAEERMFYMTFIETLAKTIPLTNSLIEAQELLHYGKCNEVIDILLDLEQILLTITHHTFHKIDLSPFAKEHSDPVVWSLFVAPLSAPIRKGEIGLSGAAIPFVHLLDGFFERSLYDSKLGRGLQTANEYLPPKQQQFCRALASTSAQKLILESGDQELQGLFHHCFERYAGQRGWLSIHRLKVFGFMEVGFRAGRTATNGGFSGTLEERAWELLDDDLDDARLERRFSPPKLATARIVRSVPVDLQPVSEYFCVTLDITGTGLPFHAGDLCGMFPYNLDDIIQSTMTVLEITGSEEITLNQLWRHHFAQFFPTPPTDVNLYTLLQYASLRPVSRRTAIRLSRMTQSKVLSEIIDRRVEDQFELWEILQLIKEEGYDLTRLWKAQPWEKESILRFVHPNALRFYSVSSRRYWEKSRTMIDLTVKHLSYKKEDQGQWYRGTASTYLTSVSVDSHREVSICLATPSRFFLPQSSEDPIVMFSAGSGIAPFRSFWQERMGPDSADDNWLLVGARTLSSVLYLKELRALVDNRKLQMDVVCSQEDRALNSQFSGARGHLKKTIFPKGYIDRLMVEEDVGKRLWRAILPVSEGGLGARFYICGQARFALTVFAGLRKIIEQYKETSTLFEGKSSQDILCFLMARKQLMSNIFTTSAPQLTSGEKRFDVSEVAKHNSLDTGYWMIVMGEVYDITPYLFSHPGGNQILMLNAGLDATQSYQKVEHHLNPDVHAMLNLFKIGHVRRLHFSNRWGVIFTKQGAKTYFIRDVFRMWVRYLYLLIEQQNILHNQDILRNRATVIKESVEEPPRLKGNVFLEQRTQFNQRVVSHLMGEWLNELWTISVGFFAKNQSVHLISEEVSMVLASADARNFSLAQQACIDVLKKMDLGDYDQVIGAQKIHHIILLIEQADSWLLEHLKEQLLQGIVLFEEHEEHILEEAGLELLDILSGIPPILAQYYQRLGQIAL